MTANRLGLWWLILLLFGGCSAPTTTAEDAASVSYAALPPTPLFAIGANDTLVVLDADTHALVGTLSHPDLSGSREFVVTPDNQLVITLNTDADHVYDAMLVLDAETGAILRRFETAPAPFTPRRAPDGTLLIGHSALMPQGYDAVLVEPQSYAIRHQFKLSGYITDAVFADSMAYIAASDPAQPELIAYDLQAERVARTYPLHSPAINLALKDEQTLYATLFGIPDAAGGPCDREAGPVIRLDPTTGLAETLTTLGYPITSRSLTLTPQGRLILVDACASADHNTIMVFDPATKTVLHTTTTDLYAAMSPITPKGEIALFGADGIVRWLDAETLAERGTTSLPIRSITDTALGD